MKRLLELILNHAFVVLLIFTAGAVALGWQAHKFEIDASAETLLTRDNKLYIQTQVMNERFSPEEFLLVGYKPKSHPVLSERTFDDLKAITNKLQKLDRVQSVRSLLNVPMLSLMDDPLTAGNPAQWTIENKDFPIEALQKAFNDHPIYENLLINEAQTATAVQVLFKPNETLRDIQQQIVDIQEKALQRELTEEEHQQIEKLQQQAAPIEQELSETRNREIQAIREILAPYEDEADVYLGGVHVLAFQLIQIIKNDLLVFGGIIAAVICLVLLVLFRKIRWVLVPVLCCFFSVLLTVGLFGMLGLKTTVISSNFIALQLILTLAIVIHLIVQYREFSTAHTDWDQRQIVRETMKVKAKPCFYAGLTTSVGFGSLLFTGIQPVITFGWMMIIAMFFSITVSLILFPALLTFFRRKDTTRELKAAGSIVSFFARTSQKRGGLVVAISLLGLALGTGGLFLLHVENSFINYFDESTQVHRELSFIDQELGGFTPLDIVIDIPAVQKSDPELIMSAETVQQLQRVQKMLNQQEGVGKVLSVVNFTELAKEVNEGKPLTEYELTAIYRTLDKEVRKGLVSSFFSPEHNQLRISARIQDATEGLNRAQLLEDIQQGMEELGIAQENYSLTSLFVLYQDILQRLFRSQILALGFVYIVLTLTFCLVFRSIKVGLIGVAPNILSTVTVLGVMGWAGIPLDLMTITIASIAMGIAVDDTIHYVDRYLTEAKQEAGNVALERTHLSVGYAILYTSLIIMMGFSLLLFSDFVPSVQFGLLASLAMALALIWNLSLLPVLLEKFVGRAQ
jgi:predicted RND superfamily exporter protein